MFLVCPRNSHYPLVIIEDIHANLKKLYGVYEILFQRELDHCSLDPGGMLCISAPYLEFKIGRNNFGVKADQIEPTLHLWKKARITDDSLVEVPMWMRVLVMPKKMYLEIQAKLEALHTSDVAIHAELNRDEIFTKLEGSGYFFPREEQP